eukprot:gene9633-20023_t
MIVNILELTIFFILFDLSLSYGIKFSSQNKIYRLFSSPVDAISVPSTFEDLKSGLLDMCDEYVSLKRDSKEVDDKNTVLGLLERNILTNIESLAVLNQISNPTAGWSGSLNGTKTPCVLDGAWKLRFTNAPDVTFKTGKRGPVTIMQFINSTSQTFTNVLKFDENPGKTKMIQVIVDGKDSGSNRMELKFSKVVVTRNPSRFFKKITIPLPNLSFLNRILRTKKPYFDIVYLDEDLRIQKTGENKYFVQTRLFDAWDPMKGWVLISGC